MKEYVILYHGTEFEYVADEILKNGFKECSYFTHDFLSAIEYGGEYVFSVVFIKEELPEYWQVRCDNKIPPIRIVNLYKHKQTEQYTNEGLRKAIFNNALKVGERKPYYFKEKNPDFIKIKKHV